MSDQVTRSAIYQALVIHDVDESVRITGQADLIGSTGGDGIKKSMIDTLLEDDYPEWDPDKIRIVEFLWSDVPCVDDQ